MPDSPRESELETWIALANRLADAARPIALNYFRADLTIEAKADTTRSPWPTARPRRPCGR